MIHQDLYNSICQAKIKDSLFLVSKLILQDLDKNIDVLQNTFIAICSYIGSFISLTEIRLLLDTINDVNSFIEDEEITIKNIYVLVAKLCLLCDIYIKTPITKTGTLNIKIVRDKIIDMFENESFKLSSIGITKFEGILPPTDSPSYTLATQIVTGYAYILKQLENISGTDINKLSDIANKIRNSFDYIIRKRYSFETKFYESDNDAVWFLWGILSLLYTNSEMDSMYQLFSYGYSKKLKNYRIGLLWASAILMVYIAKKDASRIWNTAEVNAIKKIEEVSLILYNDIKRELIKKNEIPEQQTHEKNNNIDGIEYISSFRPVIQERGIEISSTSTNAQKEIKSIRYKRDYMI
jgi:hypothetical protein